jgi:transposase
MNVRYVVTLSAEERGELEALVTGGAKLVRVAKRAQILLAAADGETDERISKLVRVGTSTVYRTKRRCVEDGIEEAIHDKERVGGARKLSVKEEALLVATACSKPTSGRARWTMQLLADEMVRLTQHSGVSRETIRRRLTENEIKPWQRKMWCVPKVDAEYVARMEDVLDLYASKPNPKQPIVSFDESPVQLIGESRQPIPATPGCPARVDYEYRRNGTANLFIFLDVHRPWRHVKVTDRRAGGDFAECMRDLVDVHYPKAQRIRVVLDNLSTHTPAALSQSFAPDEARRILRRLEFHYVPKHASWLNMVEIEIGVLKGQCLARRIADRATLVSEITSWERARNKARARIRWLFTVERARRKMGRAYPPLPLTPQQIAA